MFHVPNKYRTKHPQGHTLYSDESYGNAGAFIVPIPLAGSLFCIASDGMGFDHVSVKPEIKKRTPTWGEMQFIKDMFWDGEDAVMQLHPPESTYVNCHKFVLHLWRPTGDTGAIPLPSIFMV